MYSLDRLKLIGTTYLNDKTWPLVDKYSIMMLEHLSTPNNVVAKSRNYTALFLETPWDDVTNPRLDQLRCSVLERYVAPTQNTVALSQSDPHEYTRVCNVVVSDSDANIYRDDASLLEPMFVSFNRLTGCLELSRSEVPVAEHWHIVGRICIPTTRLLAVLQQAGFNDAEIENYCKSSVFHSELLSKEVCMYSSWLQQNTTLHKLVITDNNTGDVVFKIDPYYTSQFRYNFTDVHAAFWIGQLEEERHRNVNKEAIGDCDLEL